MFGLKRPKKQRDFVATTIAKIQIFFTVISLIAIVQFARILGLPPYQAGLESAVWLVLFRFLNVLIHEGGHALMAWVQHAEIREFMAGPISIAEGKFQWNRKAAGWLGGRVKAIGLDIQHPRTSRILFAAGGPVANLITAGLMLLIFLLLPGTPWAEYWWIAAANIVIAGYLGLFNLIPLRNWDGAQILNTLMWTATGKGIVARDRYSRVTDAARAAVGRADFESVVRIWEEALVSVRKEKSGNPFTLSLGESSLGLGYLTLRDWEAAEKAFHSALTIDMPGTLGNQLAGNNWYGLHKIYMERHQTSEAVSAYMRARAALKRAQRDRDPKIQRHATALLCKVHINNGDWEEALTEANEAVRLSDAKDPLSHATAQTLLANALLGSGQSGEGLAAARQAEMKLRFGNIPETRRNLAWYLLGELGEILVRHGQPVLGEAFMQDAVGHLELAGATKASQAINVRLGRSLVAY
jgi:Zn-dependent protease